MEQDAMPKAAACKDEEENLQGCKDSSRFYLELCRQVSDPALEVSQLCCHRPLRAAIGAAQGWASAVPACPGALPAGARAACPAWCGGAAWIVARLPPGPQAVV